MTHAGVGNKGVGILGWMFLIFLTLKLTGYIGWSWWWVTAPLWGPFVTILTIVLVVLLFAATGQIFKSKS